MSELERQELEPDGAGAGEREPAPAESPEPAAAPAPAPPGWNYNERALFVGSTQSGKSELINHLFSSVRTQRVLVDTKHEFVIPGVEIVTSPERIDWTKPIIHYRDQSGSPDEFDELFGEAFRRPGPRVVAVHEAGDLCAFNPGRTPPGVIAYANKGQGFGKGLLIGTQRPVMIPVHARTEASHVFLMIPPLGPDDHDTIAKTVQLRRGELYSEYDRAAELGVPADGTLKYSFLWWHRGSRAMTTCPPLPEQLRQRIIVKRITPPGMGGPDTQASGELADNPTATEQGEPPRWDE